MNLDRIASRHLSSLTQPLRMRRDYGSADGKHWGAFEDEPPKFLSESGPHPIPLFWDRPLEDAISRAKSWADKYGRDVLIFDSPRGDTSKPVKRITPAGKEEPLEVGIEPEVFRDNKPAPGPFRRGE